MKFSNKEEIIQLTPLNPFERLEDGRPKVPDDLLERMKLVTLEEAWAVLDKKYNYKYQIEGNWLSLHEDEVMVGRALTITMVPFRPDLNDVVEKQGKEEGRSVGIDYAHNRWAFNHAGENDVIVADTFGKVIYRTNIGDNLATSLATKGAKGMIVNGSIRDPSGCAKIPNFNVFCKAYHPTAIRDMTAISLNGVTRLSSMCIVLPGDVVLATSCGIAFIPPHLVLEVIETSETIRSKDDFRQQRIKEKKYAADEVYNDKEWPDYIQEDFDNWMKTKK